ncbi:thiamine phosphate synthase [Dyadobacter sp. CY261]|uniref:thiamine phosphate synthase n=1 Tax=Dyadobacter sp. CY261 TaxID=2907203 RepID=UPI001F28EE1C|nr:thiamine phosphate synthase [Dyadobacter sp. CY261]MCF0070683.1 thiamine phosphate synthase [Dyadobacter sp. CY261]
MKELIVITHPEMLSGEAVMINDLFVSGLARLHVRKPEASENELLALLENIDPQFRDRIALHQHHELTGAFGITGLHFTERNRLLQDHETLEALKSKGFTLSTSLHDPADLKALSTCFDYAFVGPVFHSISKENYKAALPGGFKLDRLGFPGKVIALGGIDAQNLESSTNMGFDGAAVLGCIWQSPENALKQFQHLALLQSSAIPGLKPGALDLAAASERSSGENQSNAKAIHCPRFQPGDFESLHKSSFIDRFHFISNETVEISHIESIRLALEAGCRWIQLRVKNKPEVEVLPIAWEATRLCDSYGAKLIINDFPRVALAVQAYGLHLGLTDMPVPDARSLVGEKMVVGGTANTFEDMVRRIKEGADYIGLGPFRFTTTKQNLSPILGLQGYRILMQRMAEAGYITPVIAIGGIGADDIKPLREAGVYGVAMSSSLIAALNPQKFFYQIQQALC